MDFYLSEFNRTSLEKGSERRRKILTEKVLKERE